MIARAAQDYVLQQEEMHQHRGFPLRSVSSLGAAGGPRICELVRRQASQ